MVAVADGTVEFAGWEGGYGRLLKIRHGGKMETFYGHLSRFGRHPDARAAGDQCAAETTEAGVTAARRPWRIQCLNRSM